MHSIWLWVREMLGRKGAFELRIMADPVKRSGIEPANKSIKRKRE